MDVFNHERRSAAEFANNNDELVQRDDLIQLYHEAAYTQVEILLFLSQMHGITLSLSQLKRIIKRLNLCRRGIQTDLHTIVSNILTELRGPGNGIGYRTMWRRLLTEYDCKVSRKTVQQLMQLIDPEGVQLRASHRLRRRVYVSQGPNFLIHIDGYDKLKPYGFAIHGAIDGFSRRVLWLKVANTNNDPRVIAGYYVDLLKDLKGVPRLVRADRGTENSLVEDIQVALRWYHKDDMAGPRSFLYGQSTGNQRIERWWGSLRPHLNFYINLFRDMQDMGVYQPRTQNIQRECMRYCFMNLIQKELDRVRKAWNEHPIRPVHNSESPSGKPDVLYFMPELHGAHDHKHLLNEIGLAELEEEFCVNPTLYDPMLANAFDEISTRYHLPQPTNPDEALTLYTNIIDKLELQ